MISLPSVPLPEPLASAPLWAKVAGAIVLSLAALYIYLYPYREATLSFRNVPGPPPSSLFWGNLKEIIAAPPNAVHDKWITQYGPTVRYQFLFGKARFFTADPVALGYILQHSDDFIKPKETNETLERMLGRGVLTAEGSTHRRQRRVLNPAFGPKQIREMSSIFWDKGYELQRKVLGFFDDDDLAEKTSPTPAKDADKVAGALKIDMMKYLGQATLDVIGLAGFGYDFHSLSDSVNELAEAFSAMFSAAQQINALAILQNFFPVFRLIPTKAQTTVKFSHGVTVKVGQQIVDAKKKMFAEQFQDKNSSSGQDRDLLSLLMKANMAPDLRPDQRLNNDEVLAQITTFILAGNETSSTALTWALYRLALNPDVQAKLRAEMAPLTERPELDELAALPYLDNFVREVLRLDPPVPGTVRYAHADMVVPLGTPVKGRDGKMVESVVLKKGQQIFIPIMSVNKMEEIWGDDAKSFNPDRFNNKNIPTTNVPGVYGNLLSFLGGARNCIGYRFAIAEIKIFLFVLVRTFSFEQLPSKPEVEQKSSIVMRPRIVGEEAAGLQMPLLVRPLDE